MSNNFYERVSKIQKELKAPKSQYNNFGKYAYRNQEDILEAVKPLLNGLVLTVNDQIVEVGGRIYVKATSTITDGVNSVSNTAFAREPQDQKGMNEAQITGSTSSYARKYSLNGLFLIDDTKDADTDAVTAASKGVAMPEKTEAKLLAKNAEEKLVAANPENKVMDVPTTPAKKSFSSMKNNKPKVETKTNNGDIY